MTQEREERNKQLILSIISHVNEQGGEVTKTKLLMLIYLFDIEWYRTHGETFTGWNWYFDPVLHGGLP